MKKSVMQNIKLNVDYVIVGFNEYINLKLKRRLLELGFVINSKIKVINKSFLKKVYLIELNNCLISLRTNIVNQIKLLEA